MKIKPMVNFSRLKLMLRVDVYRGSLLGKTKKAQKENKQTHAIARSKLSELRSRLPTFPQKLPNKNFPSCKEFVNQDVTKFWVKYPGRICAGTF